MWVGRLRKPSKRKFETVPVSEIRKKASEFDGAQRVTKTVDKEEPYAVVADKDATASIPGS